MLHMCKKKCWESCLKCDETQYFFIQPNTLSLYKVYVRQYVSGWRMKLDMIVSSVFLGPGHFQTACFDDLVE
jgi:hypothetical protein